MEFQVRHGYGGHAPEAVWQALFDPERLERAIPGCRRLEPQGEGVYRAWLGLDLGPIRGGFEGQVILSDADPPRRYRLRLQGEGPPGQVTAEAWISLEPQGEGTALLCQARVETTGTLAAVGERLVSGIGKMLVGRFFSNLEHQLAGREAAG